MDARVKRTVMQMFRRLSSGTPDQVVALENGGLIAPAVGDLAIANAGDIVNFAEINNRLTTLENNYAALMAQNVNQTNVYTYIAEAFDGDGVNDVNFDGGTF